GKIEDALALEIENHSFHPIVNYLKSLKWDGEDRIDSLLIDYFGAPDTQYTRMAMRKMLVGAVARVLVPGVKFDLVLTLVGGQGIYKSTFINKLGKKWFSDTFNTVQGKEAFEQVQGAWIIEIAELSGLKKAEVEVIKQYISKREDQFRPAYGRTIEIYKRQCVFFGTTNNDTFLRDPTGNRRFMPVDVRPDFITKSVKDDLTEKEIDQIWAEAYELYICGETLYLDKETEKLAFKEQCAHSETDDRRGLVEIYLDTLLPEEWYSWDLYTRRDYLNDPLSKKGTIKRDSVCVSELWCECLGKDKAEMSRYNTRDLNDIMKTLPDWSYVNSTKNFTVYGTQKYYAKKID
ncbi:MAG: virulence-associated E family protein, partial [Niameybacter sp.]